MRLSLGLPLLICLGILPPQLGCSKPSVTIAVASGVDPAAYGSVALDPRKDLAILIDGVRPMNPEHLKELALKDLGDRGYATLPVEQAESADLWLDVFALGIVPGKPGGASGEAPRSGGRGGGHGRGGMGGGMSQGGAGGGGGRADGGGQAQRSPQPEGRGGEKLILQLVDRSAGRVIWSGTWEREAGKKPKPTPGFEDPMVVHLQEILGQFPLRKAGPH